MPDKKIITADGSATFHSSEYSETYHSTSGAIEEANKKYSEVVGIEKYENVSILNFCFGLGYNSAAAIDIFTGKKIRIVGLEIYDGIIQEITRLGEEYPFRCRQIMQKIATDKSYKDNKVDITLIMGDARETIKTLDEKFDVVFFDPFSPKNCPELWTKEVFDSVYKVMKKGGKLATYSCARVVRDNLKAAGFKVTDTPPVGRRAPGTLAIK